MDLQEDELEESKRPEEDPPEELAASQDDVEADPSTLLDRVLFTTIADEESCSCALPRSVYRVWHPLRPFAVSFAITLLSLLLLRLAPPPMPASSRSNLAGEEVAIKSLVNGRYLEVADDLWLYASSFTHNKHAARFVVEPADDTLVASLASMRQFREAEGSSTSSRWDMRSSAAGAAAPWLSDDSASEAQRGDEAGEEGAAATAAVWEEAVLGEYEYPLRRHEVVLLKSPHAGGYLEVVGRAEGEEYVVRISRDAYISYRSLFIVTGAATPRRRQRRAPRPVANPGRHAL